MSTIDDALIAAYPKLDELINSRRPVFASEIEDYLLTLAAQLHDKSTAQEQEIARLQDQLATARKGQQRILTAWDDWYDGPETMIGGDMIEAILALKADAIPARDHERLLVEEARDRLLAYRETHDVLVSGVKRLQRCACEDCRQTERTLAKFPK